MKQILQNLHSGETRVADVLAPGLGRNQLLIQTRATLNLVVSPNYSSSDEKQLLEEIQRYLGSEIIIKLEYLKSIPREANGKFRQIVSKVFQQQQSLTD